MLHFPFFKEKKTKRKKKFLLSTFLLQDQDWLCNFHLYQVFSAYNTSNYTCTKVIITSLTNSWLGAPGRFLMTTTIPSWSKPLYTSPNFPTPIKLLSLKFFVARDSSSIWNRLVSRIDNSTPACLPTSIYHHVSRCGLCYTFEFVKV